MQELRDLTDPIVETLPYALAAAAIVAGVTYGCVRLFHLRPKIRNLHSWKTDLRPATIAAVLTLICVFLPLSLLDYFFSGSCHSSYITEVFSPDNRHKLVVYNFDCGATTDFSLNVSLLRSTQKLPATRRQPRTLYYCYHQVPTLEGPDRNFEVSWLSSDNVLVKVSNMEGQPIVKTEDGVTVRIEPLP